MQEVNIKAFKAKPVPNKIGRGSIITSIIVNQVVHTHLKMDILMVLTRLTIGEAANDLDSDSK